VLKKHHQTLFSPSLSDEKIKAINELEFGTLGKIFLEFEETIYPENVMYYAGLWTEKDLRDVQGTDKEW
jgi:spermine oxidase